MNTKPFPGSGWCRLTSPHRGTRSRGTRSYGIMHAYSVQYLESGKKKYSSPSRRINGHSGTSNCFSLQVVLISSDLIYRSAVSTGRRGLRHHCCCWCLLGRVGRAGLPPSHGDGLVASRLYRILACPVLEIPGSLLAPLVVSRMMMIHPVRHPEARVEGHDSDTPARNIQASINVIWCCSSLRLFVA